MGRWKSDAYNLYAIIGRKHLDQMGCFWSCFKAGGGKDWEEEIGVVGSPAWEKSKGNVEEEGD